MARKRTAITLLPALLLTVSLATGGRPLQACPFCSAVSQTFSEEIESMDVVAIGRLVKAPPAPESTTDADAPLPKATFRVERLVKGQQWISPGGDVEVLYFGDADKAKAYLMMGTDPPDIAWSTPLALSPRALEYVLKLPTLPKDPSRLEFFQEYLEDDDEMLARDAYDEFAKVPYAGVKQLKDKIRHDRLLTWIQDPDVPASRRRLYFVMLGVSGSEADTPLLEKLMRSSDRKDKAGLDALIAAYLSLKGEAGLPLIEELFLKNPDAEYADTYAAIMAIRFHGTSTELIDRSRLVRSLRYMLERPQLADLVIQDLAKWEDWEVMPRLVALFKEADEKSSWVRVPVVNYLRACPLPEASQHIAELEKIDPDAVKRARTFFPFDATGESALPATTEAGDKQPSSNPPDNKGAAAPSATPANAPTPSPTSSGALFRSGRTLAAAMTLPVGTVIAQSTDGVDRGGESAGPNRTLLFLVPLLAAGGLWVVIRLIVGLPPLTLKARR